MSASLVANAGGSMQMERERRQEVKGEKKVVSETMKRWKNTLKYKAGLKTTEREGWEGDEEGGG